MALGIETAHEQIAPFGYEVRYQRVPPADTDLYVRRVKEALKRGVDAVGLVNNYEFEMERVFALLEARSIPYITFNIDADDTRRRCFIGPDYTLEGRLAADFLGKILPATGSVGILFSDVHKDWELHSKEISSQRLQGFLAYLGDHHPRMHHQVHYIDHTLPERTIGRRIREFLTSAGKDLDGIYCIPQYSSIAGRCLQESGRAGKVAFVTFDLYPELKALINADVVTGSICQKPVQQGYYAVKILELLLETKSPPKCEKFFISPHIVVKANVEVEDDLFTISRIMSGDSRSWAPPTETRHQRGGQT